MASEDLIRLMQSFFMPTAQTFQEAAWHPPADVYQTRRGWLVKFDLAGVRPEDIEVTAQGSRLTVRGTRRDWVAEEECACYRMEIAYSHFERTLELPCNLDAAHITSEYHYGMLLVRIETEAPQ
jgi:HSP20 family protein